jgi:protein-tyrosine phosphatase
MLTQPDFLMGGETPELRSVPNFRDFGGYETRDGGRVRRGLLYRSGALDRLDGADLRALEELGICTVFDLRHDDEREAHPDRLPDGVSYVVANPLAESPEESPTKIARSLATPQLAAQAFGMGGAAAFFHRIYRELVVLDSAHVALRRVYSGLARPSERPALLHCATGKDRTGWAVAALQLWLGVPEDAVMADFLASTSRLEPTVRPLLDDFAARGGDPELLRPLVGVMPEYLETALAAMRSTYGDVNGYFTAALGLDAVSQGLLRTAFVEEG